jgi:hypothetical protein
MPADPWTPLIQVSGIPGASWQQGCFGCYMVPEYRTHVTGPGTYFVTFTGSLDTGFDSGGQPVNATHPYALSVWVDGNFTTPSAPLPTARFEGVPSAFMSPDGSTGANQANHNIVGTGTLGPGDHTFDVVLVDYNNLRQHYPCGGNVCGTFYAAYLRVLFWPQ